MALRLFSLQFHSPLHIGNSRADYGQSAERLHSDTLYAAVIQSWATLGMGIPEQDPGFAITSLFPYCTVESGKKVYFFPKPGGVLQASGYETHKKAKKIRFLDAEYFVKALQGGLGSFQAKPAHGQWYTEQFASMEDAQFMKSEVFPRARVPRYGEKDAQGNLLKDTQIYYIERLFFRKGSGLFFLAWLPDDRIAAKVRGALKWLEEEGIGTDRHIGHGMFTFEEEPFTLFDQLQPSEEYLNLSLFCPESASQLATMLHAHSSYELVRRGGWLTTEPHTNLRKRSVNMFREGAQMHIAPDTAGFQPVGPLRIGGATVNLQPDNDLLRKSGVPEVAHPVLRPGKAIFVPVSQ